VDTEEERNELGTQRIASKERRKVLAVGNFPFDCLLAQLETAILRYTCIIFKDLKNNAKYSY